MHAEHWVNLLALHIIIDIGLPSVNTATETNTEQATISHLNPLDSVNWTRVGSRLKPGLLFPLDNTSL